MKKIHVVWLALVAVFAFGAMMTSVAAAAQWEVDGVAVTAELPSQVIGELRLVAEGEPLIGTVEVLCSGKLDGALLPGGLDVISEVLSLTDGAIGAGLTGTALACTNVLNCPTPLVWPVGLPWESQLTSATTDVLTATSIGFEVQCMGIIGEPGDTCTQSSTTNTIENMTSPETALGSIKEIKTSNCTTAGANKGSLITDENGELWQVEANGEKLTVATK